MKLRSLKNLNNLRQRHKCLLIVSSSSSRTAHDFRNWPPPEFYVHTNRDFRGKSSKTHCHADTLAFQPSHTKSLLVSSSTHVLTRQHETSRYHHSPHTSLTRTLPLPNLQCQQISHDTATQSSRVTNPPQSSVFAAPDPEARGRQRMQRIISFSAKANKPPSSVSLACFRRGFWDYDVVWSRSRCGCGIFCCGVGARPISLCEWSA